MPSQKYATGKTWSVGTKKYSISKSAAEIALKYGPNVSKGILGMQRRIDVLVAVEEEYQNYCANKAENG